MGADAIRTSFSEREELNIPLCGLSDAEKPTLKVFAESKKGRELIDWSETGSWCRWLRRALRGKTMRIDTGKSICEAALDTGKIITAGGNADIRELELELFSGSVEDLEEIGSDIAERFSLRGRRQVEIRQRK